MSAAAGLRAALAATSLCLAPLAHAGRSCEAVPPDALAVQRAMTLAERVAKKLDESNAQVVVIGRVGQDLSRYGQRYSHMALAYREPANGGTVWRVVHKLNHCASAQAFVYRQGLGEFFLDDLFDYQAGIVALAPEVQAKVLPTLRDNQRLAQLHTPAYSMVAYPWSQTYQQSNQWLLETFAMSQDPGATTRERAQAWLRLQDYQPTTLRLGALTRLGARMTAANIAFDDHPNEKRFSDRIETVTVDSVFRWLERSGLGSAPLVVR
jgi:hypothetical protein